MSGCSYLLLTGNFPSQKLMKTYPRTCSLHIADLKTSLNFLIPSYPKTFWVRFIIFRFWLPIRVETRASQDRAVKPQHSSLWGTETSESSDSAALQRTSTLFGMETNFRDIQKMSIVRINLRTTGMHNIQCH